MTLRNGAGLFWRSVARLSVDPTRTRGLAEGVPPFKLLHGRTYDLVFLSRDRKARGRGDVETLLDAMGFSTPDALMLLRRSIRVPRQSSSFSEWLAVVRWDGPDTVTTREDPFLFLSVAPSEAATLSEST